MNELESKICDIIGVQRCQFGCVLQELWSGYGAIRRAQLDDRSIIVKHIDISKSRANRRGWATEFAHLRKVNSYRVERHFYERFAISLGENCKVPTHLGTSQSDDATLLLLEDLDDSGFPFRMDRLSIEQIQPVLKWLACFHATFVNENPDGLWSTGTYWHLSTRPQEFEAMPDGPLKTAAHKIDDKLNSAQHQTFVHGDAKVANFCFPIITDSPSVAAVDFQYVGGGIGIKDVAYLVSSCMDQQELESNESQFLDLYFSELRLALSKKMAPTEINAIEREWRELYPYAWADFCRFLIGWSPGHWKLNDYSNKLTNLAIEELA